MMKFGKTIAKNFRVLFKLKLSLFAIILGPLVILFLIGFAFNSSSNIQLSVGYVNPDNSALTLETIDSLANNNYILKAFEGETSCIRELELGLLHTCILFPEDFVVENDKTNNIIFYVDKSRINLVYNVIDSVSEKIGFKSDELSKSLTNTLISTLSDSSSNIDNALSTLITSKSALTKEAEGIDEVKEDLEDLNLNTASIDLDLDGDIKDLASYSETIKDKSSELADDGFDLITTLRGYSEVSSNSNLSDDVDDLEDILENINSSAASNFESSETKKTSILDDISDAESKIEDIESQLSAASSVRDDVSEQLDEVKSSINSINTDLDVVKETLEKISNEINTIEITSTDQIVNPITTTIETISSDQNQLVILFPYVLILIIMFVGLMLSSTLVIVEKKSRAAFRVFTTPTRDEYFIFTTFVTAFIIVFLQTAAIITAMYFLSYDVILANIVVNAALLILAMSFFILLGMAIGHMMPNQQGSNMLTITAGAVFLFISNIVVPLETISEQLKIFATYNPYVIASETLRKSILFSIPAESILRELISLLSYCIIIIVMIIVIQKVMKVKYFSKKPKGLKNKKVDFSHKYIFMNKTKITNEKQFVTQLNEMSDKEYKRYLRKRKKDIRTFFLNNIKKKKIAENISKLNRIQLIDELNKENKEMVSKLKEAKEQTKKESKEESSTQKKTQQK